MSLWCAIGVHAWKPMKWGVLLKHAARECRNCLRFEAYILDAFYATNRFEDAIDA